MRLKLFTSSRFHLKVFGVYEIDCPYRLQSHHKDFSCYFVSGEKGFPTWEVFWHYLPVQAIKIGLFRPTNPLLVGTLTLLTGTVLHAGRGEMDAYPTQAASILSTGAVKACITTFRAPKLPVCSHKYCTQTFHVLFMMNLIFKCFLSLDVFPQQIEGIKMIINKTLSSFFKVPFSQTSAHLNCAT